MKKTTVWQPLEYTLKKDKTIKTINIYATFDNTTGT